MIQALLLSMFIVFAGVQQTMNQANDAPFYRFTMKTIDGKEQPLASYQGKVVLVVNVASRCGHTPQYEDLEATYRKYGAKGLAISDLKSLDPIRRSKSSVRPVMM